MTSFSFYLVCINSFLFINSCYSTYEGTKRRLKFLDCFPHMWKTWMEYQAPDFGMTYEPTDLCMWVCVQVTLPSKEMHESWEKEKDHDLPSAISLTEWFYQLRLDQTEAKHFSHVVTVFHLGDRGPSTCTILHSHPWHISRELHWKQNSQHCNWHSSTGYQGHEQQPNPQHQNHSLNVELYDTGSL